jgi:hypothetical protein
VDIALAASGALAITSIVKAVRHDEFRVKWLVDLPVFLISFLLAFGGLFFFTPLGIRTPLRIDVSANRGEVGPWIAGAAAVLAALAALGIAIYSYLRRKRNDAVRQAKGKERALRRASLVEVVVRQTLSLPTGSPKRFFEISIRNGGSTDLYAVTWFAPQLQYQSDTVEATDVKTAGGEPVSSLAPRGLAAQRSRRIYVHTAARVDEESRQSVEPKVKPLVEFVDAEGYRLGYVGQGGGEGDASRPDWIVVDDDYPPHASGSASPPSHKTGD